MYGYPNMGDYTSRILRDCLVFGSSFLFLKILFKFFLIIKIFENGLRILKTWSPCSREIINILTKK